MEVTGAREVVSGRVVRELRRVRRSVVDVSVVIDGLAVELSGMRDCGGVSEALDSLEPVPLRSSILAGVGLVVALMWRCLWQCKHCGGCRLGCWAGANPNPDLHFRDLLPVFFCFVCLFRPPCSSRSARISSHSPISKLETTN